MHPEPRIILLIEDNDDHAELAEFYIGEHHSDVEVIRFADGEQVMEYLTLIRQMQRPLPWLSLLDLKLPKYDGHEILAVIKADEFLTSMPVVVFTTSSSVQDIGKALHNHANSYITKPVEPERYGEVISEILGYWELHQHAVLADR